MKADEPGVLVLLDLARESLLKDLAAKCSGKDRYVALMIANALAIAERELMNGQKQGAEWEADLKALGFGSDRDLVCALRKNAIGLTGDLHKRLLRDAEDRVAISNPKALYSTA